MNITLTVMEARPGFH